MPLLLTADQCINHAPAICENSKWNRHNYGSSIIFIFSVQLIFGDIHTPDIAKIEVGIHGGESSAYRGTVEFAPVDSIIKTRVLDVPVFCGNLGINEELIHAVKRKGNSLN